MLRCASTRKGPDVESLDHVPSPVEDDGQDRLLYDHTEPFPHQPLARGQMSTISSLSALSWSTTKYQPKWLPVMQA